MRITFILPCFAHAPIGGFKVVYEYANQLTSRGHHVAVVHPRTVARQKGVVGSAKAHLWPLRMKLSRGGSVPWFKLDPKVEVLLVPSLDAKFIPRGDYVFATAWQTAEAVQRYPDSNGAKMYLVQDLEFWMTGTAETRKRIAETYRAGFTMIAVSSAVEDLLTCIGTPPACRIFSGLDLNQFQVKVPIRERPRGVIGFPVRREHFKGTADAVQAVDLVRQANGGLVKAAAFGTGPDPNLPTWIDYLRFPTDTELARFYNSLTMFILPSRYEAWGLPGIEAMACGAALVASDCVGVRDYARDGETALVVPRSRPDLLADAIQSLLEDDVRRCRLADQGVELAQMYTWSAAADALEQVLIDRRGSLNDRSMRPAPSSLTTPAVR